MVEERAGGGAAGLWAGAAVQTQASNAALVQKIIWLMRGGRRAGPSLIMSALRREKLLHLR